MLTTISFATAWIVYDVFAINGGGTESSISYMMYEWSFRYPILTFSIGFILGILCGHFFWRIRDTEGTKKFSDMSRGEDAH